MDFQAPHFVSIRTSRHSYHTGHNTYIGTKNQSGLPQQAIFVGSMLSHAVSQVSNVNMRPNLQRYRGQICIVCRITALIDRAILLTLLELTTTPRSRPLGARMLDHSFIAMAPIDPQKTSSPATRA